MVRNSKTVELVTTLIDADVLVYRVGFGSQSTFHKVVNKEVFDKIADEFEIICQEDERALSEDDFDYNKELINFACQELKKAKYSDDAVGPFTKKKEANDAIELFEAADLEAVIVSETVPTSVKAAKDRMDSTIAEIMHETQGDICVPMLSGKTNFRDDVAKILPYKGTRTGSRPIHYQMLRDHLIDEYDETIVSDNCEADDLISICLYAAYVKSEGFKDECKAICSSIDKDLKNTPGWHYNIVKREMEWVSSDDADKNFWYQMFIGDGCDNIPGISKVRKATIAEAKEDFEKGNITEKELLKIQARLKGGLVGPKTAEKIMAACEVQNVEHWFLAALERYTEARLGNLERALQDMTEIGRLLWMQRYEGEVYELPEADLRGFDV